MSIFGLFGKDKTEPEETDDPAPQTKEIQQLPLASKILVLVDGSQLSFAALDYTIAFATHTPCEVYAAYIIDTANLELLQQTNYIPAFEREEFLVELEVTGKNVLRRTREIGLSYGIEINTFFLRGRLSQITLQAAREIGIDTIIIGGWHRISSRKDSASAERQLLLDLADCPVIVIKG